MINVLTADTDTIGKTILLIINCVILIFAHTSSQVIMNLFKFFISSKHMITLRRRCLEVRCPSDLNGHHILYVYIENTHQYVLNG